MATCFDSVRKITFSAIYLELRLSGLKELKQTWRCPQCSYRSQIEICFITVCNMGSCRTVGEVTAPGQQGNCQHVRLPNLETIHRQQYCSLYDNTRQRQEVRAPPQGRDKINAYLCLTLSLLMSYICGVSKKFGELYQKKKKQKIQIN
jgi:hypothetical protein